MTRLALQQVLVLAALTICRPVHAGEDAQVTRPPVQLTIAVDKREIVPLEMLTVHAKLMNVSGGEQKVRNAELRIATGSSVVFIRAVHGPFYPLRVAEPDGGPSVATLGIGETRERIEQLAFATWSKDGRPFVFSSPGLYEIFWMYTYDRERPPILSNVVQVTVRESESGDAESRRTVYAAADMWLNGPRDARVQSEAIASMERVSSATSTSAYREVAKEYVEFMRRARPVRQE